MLTKDTVIDRIEILETGHVQVRRAAYILEDGKRIAGPEYHRVAYDPGTSVINEDQRVKALCKVIWTPELIASYKAKLEKL